MATVASSIWRSDRATAAPLLHMFPAEVGIVHKTDIDPDGGQDIRFGDQGRRNSSGSSPA
jgi:hypothetical protein